MKLSTNRVAIYLTALVNVTGALVPVVADLDPTQTGGVVAGLLGINALAVTFLKGWQQFEKALYQADLLQTEHAAVQEQQAAKVAAAQAVGGRSTTPRVTLPH